MNNNAQIVPKWNIALPVVLTKMSRRFGPGSDLRLATANYLKVFSGTFGRLILQIAYFVVLVNTLSLADMGIFAAASATGLMIGCFSGLGYASLAFRAAAGRHRLLGAYTALFYGVSALTMPLTLACAVPVYLLVFADKISFLGFAAIIVAETTCFRMIDGIMLITNGRGRFTSLATLLIFFSAARALAAIGLLISGSPTLETWAAIYFGVNALFLAITLVVFRPRVRLRWHNGLLVGRFKEAFLFAFVNFTADVQKDIDKLVLIVMVDERAAGLYAIASRVIEIATVPIKTFYMLYSRTLIQDRSQDGILARNLRIEAGVALASFSSYAVFLVVTAWFPTLLGESVAAARPLYAAMLLVPVFKNMMDLHSELYFAYRKMGSQAVVLLGLIVLKVVALALALSLTAEPIWWGLWLNAIFAGLWLISAVTVYWVILREPKRR